MSENNSDYNPDPDNKRYRSNDNGTGNRDYNTYPILSPYVAAIIGLAGGFFLYQFIGGILTVIVLGFDIDNAPVLSLRLMTMAGQILFMLLPALLLARWVYGDVSDVIYVKFPNWTEFVIFSIGIFVLAPLLQSYLYIQNYLLEHLATSSGFVNSIKDTFDTLNELVEKTYGSLLRANNIPEMMLVVIVVAVIPALCEEVMFRGYIQRSFEFKMKPFRAALFTAVFFGLFHFNPYGLLPLIALGVYFGLASYMSKTIVLPVFLHFLNNFGAVVLYFIFGDEDIISTEALDSSGIESNIFLFFMLTFIFTIIVFVIKKYYSKLSKE